MRPHERLKIIREKYGVRLDGTVYRLPNDVKPRIDKHGYLQQHFKVRSKAYRIAVSHLVWMAHNGDIPEGMGLNHIDGNKLNNDITNLELATPLENMRHAIRTGLKNPRAKKKGYVWKNGPQSNRWKNRKK